MPDFVRSPFFGSHKEGSGETCFDLKENQMARASICWCLKVHHGQSRCEYFWTCCVETCCFLIEMPFCAEHVHDSEGIFCVEDGFGFGSFFWLNGHQQNMVMEQIRGASTSKFECEEDN